ncbi:Unknown protein sequence [Pseudomonas amygdali pv. eriobotryae]|uniref:Uncharacterized protein n=1 Tax=Pseudomonas amygdali pv. eriobotryae TaxID=129137 RepID=A0A0P9SHL2_PSEA0|nr:hypothetical protein [Pseudomonas amygdali]KPX26186.1 Unknown protein sequence [Pseudomonas amygdali pv. eriobotryae]KWS79705.1 hypothetical protein AL052_25330 [Pseudomonas amygdali pv. eriobotryae]
MDLNDKIDKLVQLIDCNYEMNGFGVAAWADKDILEFAGIQASEFNLKLARSVSDKVEALINDKQKGPVQAIEIMAQPIFRVGILKDDESGLNRYFKAVDAQAEKPHNHFKKPSIGR